MATQQSTPLSAIAPSSRTASAEFMAELLYENYVTNRRKSPDVSVERWAKVYGARPTAEMETRYQSTLLKLRKVPVMLKRNYDVRCEATVDSDVGGKGNGHQCGEPTLQCPGCGEGSGCCEVHLFEQPDGTRVCLECDGSPQFKRMGSDAADVYELQQAVRL